MTNDPFNTTQITFEPAPIFEILTFSGILPVIWLVGLFLCVYRNDLPRRPRFLLGGAMVLQLLTIVIWSVTSALIFNWIPETRDIAEFAGILNVTTIIAMGVQAFAHALILYAFFGRFDGRTTGSAAAIESQLK